MSLIDQPSATGMTAQAEIARTTETSGAMTNTPLLALAGMIGSLKMNFKKSAIGCRTPQGPTTFGPRRICTAAHTLRSMSRRKAMMTSSTTSVNKLQPTMAANQRP